MSYEDRIALVATVQETYVLMGRALSVSVPDPVLERPMRPDAVSLLVEVELEPYVTDAEMLELLRAAYFELLERVLELERQLLGEAGEDYDPALELVGLTGTGLAVKVTGFRRSLGRILGGVATRPWVRKAFQWADIILGSLTAVPAIAAVTDAMKELKEAIKTQAEEDQGA